jgi:hypothetical protein
MKNFTMQYSSTLRFFMSVLPLVLSLFVFLGNSSANTPVGVSTAVVLTGNTFYVSPSGNDSNPGTMASPFATIQAAIAAATSGDAISVAAGTYNGPITVNKKLDINGAGIGSTIVQATDGTAFTYMAAASGSGAADRAKLRNMTVSGSGKGLRADQLVNYFTIENVKFDGCTTYGIHINNTSGSMSDWAITGCEFDGNRTGIYGSAASGINGISITGCMFQNQVNSGIYVGQSSSAPGTWSNVTISSSGFSDNGVSGGSGNGAIYAEKLSEATITGNVMTDNGNASNPRGISINLKYGSYTSIVINDNTVTETRSIQITGYGIIVQARNESPDYTSQPASLSGLDISNNNVTGFAGGIVIHNAVDWASTTINNNAVVNCTQGIGAVIYPSGNTVNSSATLNVHENSITGATYTVLNGSTNGASINADCNWHGIATCAGVDALVAAAPDDCPPYGTAGPVVYANWLNSGTDNDGGVAGFVPVSGTCTAGPIPTPSITITETSGVTNDAVICNGSSATLTASAGASYAWNTGATTAAIIVSPSATSTYTVTVTNAYSCSSNTSNAVTVNNAPSLSSVTPLTGSIGTTVTLVGTNFTGASQVKLNGVNSSYTVVSSSVITVTMPFGGTILDASVTTACGTANISTGALTVTSFSPTNGPVGSIITVSGTNMNGVTSVTIGGIPQVIITNTSNSVSFFLMPGTPTGQIVVTTGTGMATSSGIFTVTATPVPAIQQGTKRVGTGATNTSLQGQSVAVSSDGNTAIIGAPSDNSNVGGAWIFVRSGTTWTQQGGKLVGTGAVGAAKQGYSVAISADGNTVAIGGNLDNLANGAVWVFTRAGITWTQQGSKLVGTGNTGYAQQGSSLSLSADGNTLAVGGVGDNSYAGAAWVFTRVGGVWGQQGAKLVGTTGAIGKARQGCSVSLSSDGNYLISGGYNNNTRQGASWIFNRVSNVWTEQAQLLGTGGVASSYQGYAVAINADGTTAIVGGPNDVATLTGAVWIFTRSGSTWTQQGGKLTGTGASGASRQGGSVAISADGNTAVWGGFGDATNTGAMWVYKRSGSTWTQQGGKLTGSGATGPAKQGTSIAVSSTGHTALLGGPTDATNKGAVWVYVPNSVSSFTSPASDNRQQEVTSVTGFALNQNIPNPTADRTTVTFTLPEACSAEWQITDVNGRVVFMMQREYPAGENAETFDMSKYSGMFRYTLKTPFGVKTRNMTVIK